jgi:beta-galactosidase/beta-glucuronidase
MIQIRFCAAAFLLTATLLYSGDGLTSLSGEWRFRIDPQERGVSDKWWQSRLPHRIHLPGSLQEQGFGDDITADTEWLAGWGGSRKDYPDWRLHPTFEKYRQEGHVRFPYWLQPKKHYVGLAWYQRDIQIPGAWNGKRVTVYLERCHWKTSLWLDGRSLGSNDSLGAPHVYELTGAAPARHTLTIAVDNRMIFPVGLNAHSVGDQTQTAWNGIVGDIELRVSDPVWIDDVQVYPEAGSKQVRVHIAIGNITGRSQRGATISQIRALFQ